MKKILLVLAFVLISVSSFAQIFEDSGIRYKIVGNIAKVEPKIDSSAWIGLYSGDIIIPDTIFYDNIGYPVTTIDTMAFWWAKNLTSIILPSTLKRIEQQAFTNCESLHYVNIPDSVSFIGILGFSNCFVLDSIHLPSKLEGIQPGTFCNNYVIPKMTIPPYVTYIGESAFSCCYALDSVDLPESVINIDDSAFFNCGLTTVYFAAQNINNHAFGDCFNLSNIYSKAQIPPTINMNSFSGISNNAQVFVCGNIIDYQATTWGQVFNTITNAPIALCSLGLMDIETDINLHIYPNPTTDYIDISVNNNNLSFANLYDINGKVIQSFSFRNYYKLNTSTLNKGVYLLKIGAITKKIIK